MNRDLTWKHIAIFAAVIAVMFALVISREPKPLVQIKGPMPSIEDVGRSTGKTTRKFGRGFVDGFKNSD